MSGVVEVGFFVGNFGAVGICFLSECCVDSDWRIFYY